MELDHEFTVPVPVDQAWSVLLDVERIAPCMPGATLDAVDGDEYRGRMKVRVGAMTITYRGTVKIVAADETAREVTLEASAKEARGSGTAAATVRATLREDDGTTRVTVRTELNVTGRPAQFGRNILAEVGSKIIGRFAKNLATEIESPEPPAPDEKAEKPAAPAAPSTPAAPVTSEAPVQADTSAAAEAPSTSEAPAQSDISDAPAEPETSRASSESGPSEPSPTGADADGAAVPASAEPEAAAAEVARPVTAAPSARPDEPAERPEPAVPRMAAARFDNDAIDLLEVAGPSVVKRAVPAIGALVALLLVIRLLTRRRRK
ncbi:SRPBCC family protein [Actinomadura algeriensis]|uniref:Carbon monoxide dehydrogenase subunit G n=1 Tax=Actinomadura algeriensis TaxID=1679523 RepID=A0ABR9JTA8_9ACTN|nr:SRPBCC family protein [Actinomadura algeriensis]MBE1533596.1 carbon monoxide dehydrogenase subunit G [Actinomadura algeriensis]